MKPKMSNGPFTVWDNGFSFIVAPRDPDGHPHPNMALQMSAVKSFHTGNLNSSQAINRQFRKAWKYCNKLNSEAI